MHEGRKCFKKWKMNLQQLKKNICTPEELKEASKSTETIDNALNCYQREVEKKLHLDDV